ncbi:hypothetical protein DIS18_09155 [Algibacter marinivivus]|uniref:BioF2-like acetyltransferase domain-containing protein n=1 Tax=Algibacter marinivivus TaxID=2100723 RepID=A0A2U2X3Q6_9FLAO|nr:GNAT family N-acetyltransferase [Algibacter marinivivus]PWH82411.1 hypothetical protein DIS18_09155 [Algibacter marinivivus]
MNNLTEDFLESVFSFNKLPDFYKTSNSNFTEKLNYTNAYNDFPDIKNNLVLVKDIPSYISLETKALPKNIKHLSIDYYKGFAIKLDDVDNLQGYLKTRFGSSSRYKLRRSIKKLESAFDISYKMYFGEIDDIEYRFVFDEFFELLKIRSIEKGIPNNGNLNRKEYYQNLVLPLIKQKKASLFVIYNGKKPIDICLNFHADTLVFQLIRTYDICYSKFNTGYIDLMKQIEWCLDNNVRFITFSYGDFYWKRRWCNFIYPYSFDVFYNKNSIKSIIKALKLISNLKLRHKLRERGIIDKFHEIKAKIDNKITASKEPNVEISDIDFNVKINVGEKLNLYDSKYSIIRKLAFDFLFNFNEKEKDIKFYNIENKQNEYLIMGLKNKISISTK